MREIKFRAWDKINKRFVDDFTGIYDESGPNYYITYIDSDGTIGMYAEGHHYDDQFILMQYIGLKDIFIVDIYEGDVIQGNLFDARLPIAGEVVYDDHFAHWSIKNYSGMTPIRKVDRREVIGNVYEGKSG